MEEKTLVIAHRGASGYAPENTLCAFEKALEMGCDGLELDIHFSKDKHLIVCHDEKVDRTTNGKGLIKDMTLQEIKELDAGSWYNSEFSDERIPTLEEIFELIKDKDILLNIELKSGPIIYEGIEKALVNMIEEYGFEEKVIVSSFNHYSLIEVKKINKNIKTGILYMAGLVEPWKYAKRIGADAIHPFFYNIVPELVQRCKKNDILINPFTVNEDIYIMGVVKAGVSGVITNYPDKARKIVDTMKMGGKNGL